MKFNLSLLGVLVLLLSCNNSNKTTVTNNPDIHKASVQEVVHVRDYTYMRVAEDGIEKWIAAPSTNAKIGSTYYFGKTMEMKNFESKELNKTFETIYFVEKVSATVEDLNQPLTVNPHPGNIETKKPIIEKKDVKIDPITGAISISELIKNKESYNNKIVKLKGEVTKFNPAIMNVNWVHLQDGTDFNGEFDLTATTSADVNIGDIVTLEGKVSLNKDFGAGYFYTIIIENAELIN